MNSYDVVIVGGRPAGASLALRLHKAGLRVVVLDKSTFPSLPPVPSNPVLYAPAMTLLDEIGLSEADYADASTVVRNAVMEFTGRFRAEFVVPAVGGRDYVRGLDRKAFDERLWKLLQKSVEAIDGFGVSGVVVEGGRVVGVRGSRAGGAEEEFRAAVAVVGADGRHSAVARFVDAKVTLEQAAHTSTVHLAEWTGLAPVSTRAGEALHIVATGRGKNVLFFPSAGGRISVCTHMRSDRADVGGDVEGFYLRQIEALPEVRARLQGATRVSEVLGLKKVQNLYRTPGGPGWFLVGDALHCKDPVDGQGICDALLEAKLLAAWIVKRKAGDVDEAAAVDGYGADVERDTGPMFRATMKRLANELYDEPPELVLRTLIRWMLTDPGYQDRFLRFLSRDIDPTTWLTPGVVLGAVARGVSRDLKSAVGLR